MNDPAKLSELLTEDELFASLLEAHQGMQRAHAEWMRLINSRRQLTKALHDKGVSYAKIAAHLGITDGAVFIYMRSIRKKKEDA